MTLMPDPGVFTNLVRGECVGHIIGELGVSIVVPRGLSEQFADQPVSGIIEMESLSDAEIELMLGYAAALTTLESTCVALAASRQFTLCTDDAVTMNIAAARSPGLEVWPFPRLMRRWHEVTAPDRFARCAALVHDAAVYRCECECDDGQWWLKRFPAQAQQ